MPVYQYEGLHFELPDGLTKEQAISKIEAHLGKTKPTTKPTDSSPLLDTLTGIGQAAATTISGGIGGAVGWIPAALQKLNDPQNVDFEKQYAANMDAMTYEPSREKGEQYANAVGDFFNRNVIPVAPMLPHMPIVGKALNAGLRDMTKVKAGDVSLPKTNSHVDALIKADTAPKAPEAAVTDATSYAALQQEKQKLLGITTKEAKARLKEVEAQLQRLNVEFVLQREREQNLTQQSAFNRPDSLPNLTDRQSPMENMATQLGAEEPAPTAHMSPMGRMAQDLQEGSHPEARAAQDILDQRQTAMEQDVARQGGLDFNAAERGRQGEAPTGAMEAAKQESASAVSQMGEHLDALQKQLDDHQSALDAAKQQARSVEEQARLEEAQRVLDQRQAQLEFEVRRQASLDNNAAERARQEASGFREPTRTTNEPAPLVPTPFGQGSAHPLGSKQRARANVLEQASNLFDEGGGVTYLRSGFSKEDFLRAVNQLHDFVDSDFMKKLLTAPDYKDRKRWVLMTPDEFLFMAKPFGEIGPDKSKLDSIRSRFKNGEKLSATRSPLFMQLGERNGREYVTGHEGRHRALYFKERGVEYMPVELRSSLIRWDQQDLADGFDFMENYPKELSNETAYDKGIHSDWQNPPSPSETKRFPVTQDKAGDSHVIADFGSSRIKSPGGRQGGMVKFGDKEKVDFLKDTPLGKRLGDVGHAMIKSADEAVKLAKDVKDVSQNVVQQGFNYLSKGGTYLKGRLDHPVVHYTIDRMLQGHDLGKSLVQQHLHADYLPALRDLTKQERTNVFTMLNHADLTQTLLTKERMDAVGVPLREQAFVLKHQALMAETLKQINSARVAVGKKPIDAREAYSAMNMSGIHRKVVYKMLPNEAGELTRQVVGVIGADTLHVGKHSLNNLEKMLKEKDPALEFGAYQDTSKGQHPTRGTPHEAFLEVLKTIGENDPKYAEFLNTLREVAKDDPSNYLGMQKHTLQKKGVWGMEGRKSWLSPEENAKQFFENQVKYAESALSWGPLAEAAMDVNKVLRDDSIVSKHKNAVGISEAYMQNALGLNPNEFGRAVVNGINVLNKWSGNTLKPGLEMTRQAANTMMMSLSPSFLAIQLIQPLAASPAMAMFLKGRGMEGSFSTGVVKAFNTNLKVFQDKPLSAFEKDMFKYMEDRHVASADMIEKSNQIEKNAAYWTNRITQHPGAVVESVTRKQVFMSLSHMLKDSGLTKETGLFEQAQRFTDMAMNNMAQLEKPAFYHALGPLGSMAYNLKSFSHNELSRLSLYTREIAKTGNAAPLLTQLATTIALAGVMGLPFYSQFESLYDFITEQLGNPKSLTMDVMRLSEELGKATNLGEKGLYALSHGGLSAAGVDVSKRIGLGDVLPSHAADAAFAGGTKVLDMAKSAAMLAAHPTDPDYQRYAAQTLAPPFLQGPLDVAFSPEGQALKKDPTKKPDLMARRTEGDVTAKKMGLMGIHESVERQKTYQNDRIDKAFKDIANSAMVSIYQDIRHGRPIRPEMVDKFIKVGQGDPQMMEKNIQSFAENMNLTVAEQRLLRDSMSKRIPQLRSLERRTQ